MTNEAGLQFEDLEKAQDMMANRPMPDVMLLRCNPLVFSAARLDVNLQPWQEEFLKWLQEREEIVFKLDITKGESK